MIEARGTCTSNMRVGMTSPMSQAELEELVASIPALRNDPDADLNETQGAVRKVL